jgi:hypothetical protein
MITGIPIDNGDGSYTFDTDGGEPMVLRGDAAQRAFATYQAAPDVSAPPPAVPDAALYAPGAESYRSPESVIQSALGAPAQVSSPIGQIQSGPTREEARQEALADKRQRNIAAQGGEGIQALFGAPAGPNILDQPQQDSRLAAAQAKAANARGAGGGPKGAVFYESPKRPATGGGPSAPAKPSGPVPVQQTLSGTMPLSDADEAAMKRAGQGQYEAAEGITNVAAARAREEAVVRAQQVEEDRKAQAEMQARESERQRVIGEKLSKIDALANDAAADKIDPDHFWKDKGAEEVFGFGILAGLSVYASGKGGGPAYALQQMNSAIDRDMKAQEANLANKREALHAQTNLLGQLRQEFGDRESAAQAFRATKLATAQAQLDEIAARNLEPEQKAKLGEFAAALNKQVTDAKLAAGKIAYSRTERFGGVGGGGGMTAKQLLEDAEGYGKDIEGAKLNEMESSLENAKGILAKYRGKKEIPGVGTENVLTRGVKAAADYVVGEGTGEKIFYNQEERANRSAVDMMQADLLHALSGTASSEGEVKRIKKMIRGANTYGDIANAVREVEQKVRSHKAGVAAGRTPEAVDLYEARKAAARRRYVQGPTANVRPAGEEE